MSNLQKTPIVDKNGKHTTVNKKVDTPSAPSRAGKIPTPTLSTEEVELTAVGKILAAATKMKFRHANTREIFTVSAAEETIHRNLRNQPLASVTFKGTDDKEFTYLVVVDTTPYASPFEGYHALDNRVGTKQNDEFSASELTEHGHFVGYPFAAYGVSQLMHLADTDAPYPNSAYPILAGFGRKINPLTNEGGYTFNFVEVDGNEINITVPEDKLANLSDIALAPARKPWHHYDPNALA